MVFLRLLQLLVYVSEPFGFRSMLAADSVNGLSLAGQRLVGQRQALGCRLLYRAAACALVHSLSCASYEI
jgi:hypothetical protein